MAKTRFRTDKGLTIRMSSVMTLLGALYVTVMAVLIWRGVSWIAVVVIAAAIGLGQWFFSDKLATTAMRAATSLPNRRRNCMG